jgi:hypothetical protein
LHPQVLGNFIEGGVDGRGETGILAAKFLAGFEQAPEGGGVLAKEIDRGEDGGIRLTGVGEMIDVVGDGVLLGLQLGDEVFDGGDGPHPLHCRNSPGTCGLSQWERGGRGTRGVAAVFAGVGVARLRAALALCAVVRSGGLSG